MQVVALRTKAEDDIIEKLEELVKLAGDQHFVGLACVLIRSDGASFVSTLGQGNRLLMLGALTDLQYTIAKNGDAP